jgi:sortase A
MPLYRYVKFAPEKKSRRRVSRAVSFTLLSLGAFLLIWVLWPILSFNIVNAEMFAGIVTPVSDASAVSSVAYAADYTNANAWFPTSPQKKIVTPVNTYTLSIPKLKISDAMVTVAGDDLAASLVHYGGTAIPGEYGNTVIFGHSTLPQFYNPKDYKTIFSMLPSMKAGDDIDITYDGISYKYKVFDMVVSEPSDLSALEQKFDDSYLTLITCVPPGTYWQRLHVKARLVRPAV